MLILLGIIYVYLIFVICKYVYVTTCVTVKTETLGVKNKTPMVKGELLIVKNEVPKVKEEVQIIENNTESYQSDLYINAPTFGDLLMRYRRECESDGHRSG